MVQVKNGARTDVASQRKPQARGFFPHTHRRLQVVFDRSSFTVYCYARHFVQKGDKLAKADLAQNIHVLDDGLASFSWIARTSSFSSSKCYVYDECSTHVHVCIVTLGLLSCVIVGTILNVYAEFPGWARGLYVLRSRYSLSNSWRCIASSRYSTARLQS